MKLSNMKVSHRLALGFGVTLTNAAVGRQFQLE